jgi:predicted MPP superfamily phosphohydrolase
MLALCGHTHGVEIKVLENLPVVTGPPEYGKPQIEAILPVE